MDLTSALQYLQKTFQDIAIPNVLKVPAEPDNVYWLSTRDGRCERTTALPRPRNHAVKDIDSLVRALVECSPLDTKAFTSEGSEVVRKSSIWYNEDGVVGLFNDALRLDKVSMTLGESPQIESLRELESGNQMMSQIELIRFLRHSMCGCLGPTGKLLDVIRAVRFTNNQSGEQVRTQGKASIGNKIESELTGAGALPDYVRFAIPVFNNPRFLSVQDIDCSLDIDIPSARFSLTPVPMSIDNAIAKAVASVGEAVISSINALGKAEDFVVLCGSPTE